MKYAITKQIQFQLAMHTNGTLALRIQNTQFVDVDVNAIQSNSIQYVQYRSAQSAAQTNYRISMYLTHSIYCTQQWRSDNGIYFHVIHSTHMYKFCLFFQQSQMAQQN